MSDALPTSFQILNLSGARARRARTDTTALLIAKLVENSVGTPLKVQDTLSVLLEDPERAGSVILTLLNLVSSYATQSGMRPAGLQQLVDHLIVEAEKMGKGEL